MPSEAEGLKFEYHHMGIPTTVVRANERYSSKFKMYTSDSEGSQFRIQWHRFESDSPLHPLIRNFPHVAFKVTNLDKAIAGKSVLLGPYSPFAGFRVAMVEDGGVPIEFVQTDLRDDEIWSRPKSKSELYPDWHPAHRRYLPALPPVSSFETADCLSLALTGINSLIYQ